MIFLLEPNELTHRPRCHPRCLTFFGIKPLYGVDRPTE